MKTETKRIEYLDVPLYVTYFYDEGNKGNYNNAPEPEEFIFISVIVEGSEHDILCFMTNDTLQDIEDLVLDR